MTLLRDLADFVALVVCAIFAAGAICGAGTILIVAGVWNKWTA